MFFFNHDGHSALHKERAMRTIGRSRCVGVFSG